MNIAVITGASSGLGREFLRRIAKEERPDQIWAIARREDRLTALQKLTDIPIRALPLDLTQESSMQVIEQLLNQEQPRVKVLVNAAGFGKIGNYQEVGRLAVDRMIDLNCRAAVDLTLLCLPYMNRGCRILEICSTAGFQPLAHLNVYAASKSFLYRFSRALRWELFPRRINVTAVCPYWIRDTEFIETAQRDGAARRIRHFPLSSRTKTVVRWALFDSRHWLPVSTPGPVCLAHRIAAKFIPAEGMLGIWELLRRI